MRAFERREEETKGILIKMKIEYNIYTDHPGDLSSRYPQLFLSALQKPELKAENISGSSYITFHNSLMKT